MTRLRPEIDMAFLWRCSCVLEGKTPKYDFKVRHRTNATNHMCYYDAK